MELTSPFWCQEKPPQSLRGRSLENLPRWTPNAMWVWQIHAEKCSRKTLDHGGLDHGGNFLDDILDILDLSGQVALLYIMQLPKEMSTWWNWCWIEVPEGQDLEALRNIWSNDLKINGPLLLPGAPCSWNVNAKTWTWKNCLLSLDLKRSRWLRCDVWWW